MFWFPTQTVDELLTIFQIINVSIRCGDGIWKQMIKMLLTLAECYIYVYECEYNVHLCIIPYVCSKDDKMVALYVNWLQILLCVLSDILHNINYGTIYVIVIHIYLMLVSRAHNDTV